MVDYFDYTGADSLLVQYKGPDTNNEWVSPSVNVLKSSNSVVTGITPDDGPEDSFKVSIYPNPAHPGNINVEVETVENTPVSVQLVDPIGRRLLAEEYAPEALKEGIRLSALQHLSNGFYIVIVNQGKTTVRRRVIIRN
jgi:hypothetical protein